MNIGCQRDTPGSIETLRENRPDSIPRRKGGLSGFEEALSAMCIISGYRLGRCTLSIKELVETTRYGGLPTHPSQHFMLQSILSTYLRYPPTDHTYPKYPTHTSPHCPLSYTLDTSFCLARHLS